MNDIDKFPKSGDIGDWTDSQKALMEFAGLLKRVGNSHEGAPRSVIEAFAQTVQRTQLDPIARQIYCIERGGRYTIQVSIDGARLVAQRSGQYEGQTPIEWTNDGITWTQVWLDTEPPKAARAGINRNGFRETLYAVATWDGFAPRTKDGRVTGMWAGNLGPHMLGKCAEMLALRKAFPMELSGLYAPEEMDQATPHKPVSGEPPLDKAISKVTTQRIRKGGDWLEEMRKIEDKAELADLYKEIRDHGEMTGNLSKALQEYAQTLTKDSREEIVDAELVEDGSPEVTSASQETAKGKADADSPSDETETLV